MSRTLTSPVFGNLVEKNLADIIADEIAFNGADIGTILSEIQHGTYGLAALEVIGEQILAGITPLSREKVVDDVNNTASTFKTDMTYTADDYPNGMVIMFDSGYVNQWQARKVVDYDGTTKFITVNPPFYAEPDAEDKFILIPSLPLLQSEILSDATPFAGADIATILAETQSHPTLAEIEATTVLAKEATLTHATYGLDKIKAETALIKAKTDLIPAAPATEAKQDTIIAKTNALPTDPADESLVEVAITAAHATTDGKVDAVKAKTDLIPADITTQLDTNVPAIKAKTDLIPADITTQLDTNVPAIKAKTDLIPASPATEGTSTAIKAKTDALPTDPADESAVEAAITAAHATTDGKIDTVDTVVDAIKAQTDKIPRILSHIDCWSLAKQITITSVAGDKGLVDVVVSGLPSNITIIAVQGMFMCDTVQNSATGVANYLESTKIQVHKKAAGTDRDAIVLEANKVFQFTTDMIRGGTVFVADWATATAAGILAEVATNTTYEMWFDVAEALANNLVLDGAAFGLRIWFTI